MRPLIRQLASGILLTLLVVGWAEPLWAQTVIVRPDEVLNGVESLSGDQFHQRIDITLGGTAGVATRAFTITLPAEITVVTNSVTTTTGSTNESSFFAGSPTTNTLAFGLSPAGAGANAVITVEFDVTTPTAFTGIAEGGRVDTVYTINFSSDVGTRQTATLSKLQNSPLRQFQFTDPDSSIGDTTTFGGRLYDIDFNGMLPDLSHSGISGLSQSAGPTDGRTDVLYSFYLSSDSTLIRRPPSLAEVAHQTIGADRTPLVGQRQRPRDVPRTYIRENFTTVFSASRADSTNGLISLAGTVDNTIYYIYVLADPAPDRTPSTNLLFGGGAKADFDGTRRGVFTAGAFLTRSGPLLVNHPPEFVIVGWDYDDDGGDDFGSTGIVQVPSDIPGMLPADANRKDNRNITLDTGSFVERGVPINTLNNGATPSPLSSVDLLYKLEDVDNPSNVSIGIFLSLHSGLTAADLVGTGLDSLSKSFKVDGSDTLGIQNNVFSFFALTRNSVTDIVSDFIPEGEYSVYFAATDGDDDHRVVRQVQNDPFDVVPSFTTLTVTHSPNLIPDSFALNDFDLQNDGDRDVITGIDVTQLQLDLDGKNLLPGPAQRVVGISWGSLGLAGDVDIDDNATIDLYYSTRSDFRDASKSIGYTSGNSDGTDILNFLSRGDNDTHTIVTGLTEDPDGMFDNQFAWDIWDFTSPLAEGSTLPRTDTRYFIYGIITGKTTSRLISFTEASGVSQSVVFRHPPYIRGVQPAQDIQVTVEEPVVISWEAVDVDNGGVDPAAAPALGLSAADGRMSSPNIRVVLTSVDFGAVTTWATISSPTEVNRMWLANSTDGSLVGGAEVELNERVDTSFVLVGNRLRNNLGTGSSSSTLELQTNSGAGVTYFVYLAIENGDFGVAGGQPTDFLANSPVVKAPGRITFTGLVPASPSTSVRFIVPPRLFAVEDDTLRIPIVPDDGSTTGRRIDIVNIFLTFDSSLFEPIDTDLRSAGIQPFTLGTNDAIFPAHVRQIAQVVNGTLSYEFIYSNQTTGLSFFDGVQPLAFANFKARTLSGTHATTTFITMDNQEPRRSKMLDQTVTDIGAGVPPPIQVTIIRRGVVSGTVPLQGRTVSADTIAFFLREVGSFDEFVDPFFAENDIDPGRDGVQVATTGVNGEFELRNVPAGRFILVAKADRHLAGHDTLDVNPGFSLTNVQPVIDGDYVDRGFLLAGDVAGFNDSTGASISDNFIDGEDLSAIDGALFTIVGDSLYSALVDVNRDGIINASDRDFAAANVTNNTGVSGIRPVLPTFKQALAEEPDPLVRLVGQDVRSIRVGETFDVTIEAEGFARLRTYEFHIAYDSQALAVEDVVSRGDVFSNFPADMVGRLQDEGIGVVNSILGRTPTGASGSGSLATIRFRAIRNAPITQLTLSAALMVDVDHAEAIPRLGDPIALSIEGGSVVYHDAAGAEILGLIEADADPRVDFNDFIAFSRAFGSSASDPTFEPGADLNADGRVDFVDFLIFSANFGRVAVDAPSSAAAKPSNTSRTGGRVSLEMRTDDDSERLTLQAYLHGTRSLQGWGLTLAFDEAQFEFLGARAPQSNLLERSGGYAPLFLVHEAERGRLMLGSAISEGATADGVGIVAEAVFVARRPGASGVFKAHDVVLFDGGPLPSQAVTASKRFGTEGPSYSWVPTSIRTILQSILVR